MSAYARLWPSGEIASADFVFVSLANVTCKNCKDVSGFAGERAKTLCRSRKVTVVASSRLQMIIQIAHVGFRLSVLPERRTAFSRAGVD